MNSGTARHGTLLLSAFCRFPRRARLCPRKSRRHSESGRRSGRDLKHASEANYVTQRNGPDVRLGGVLVWWRRPRKPSRWGTLLETPMPRGRGRGRGGKRSSPGIASAACFSTCARTILGSGAGGGGGGARHARLKGISDFAAVACEVETVAKTAAKPSARAPAIGGTFQRALSAQCMCPGVVHSTV